jgi:hypothetical protein
VYANSPTALGFSAYNYDPRSYQEASARPPLLKIEIGAAANPSHKSPIALFRELSTPPGYTATTIHESRSVTVAGRDALEIIWTSTETPAPVITDLVPNGETTFFFFQTNAENGQPSPVFTQMVSSFTITG